MSSGGADSTDIYRAHLFYLRDAVVWQKGHSVGNADLKVVAWPSARGQRDDHNHTSPQSFGGSICRVIGDDDRWSAFALLATATWAQVNPHNRPTRNAHRVSSSVKPSARASSQLSSYSANAFA